MGKYRKFDPDFREGAVRLVLETGKPIAQVARELGVNEGTLGNWVAKARRERGEGNAPLSEPERAELARLRKENAEPRMQRDVLKRTPSPSCRRRAARREHRDRAPPCPPRRSPAGAQGPDEAQPDTGRIGAVVDDLEAAAEIGDQGLDPLEEPAGEVEPLDVLLVGGDEPGVFHIENRIRCFS
jgi:transposase